ncbi:hypothetical protein METBISCDRAFT_29318 [Metschnikowia bicuspidata]|uniref:SUI1 domain-containing protein n=1 Tax=Metschnikowia bicuspidata TaxID=27322 RepID=A0A4V1J3S5_9ASCO|nr:hypothetical protein METBISCDRAFT_29318 [Metschnikowia bicuspidata]
MFKKKPQIKASSNIKSIERRALLAKICDTYGIQKSELLKEQELALLPATIKLATYHSDYQKGTIYIADGKPVWFSDRALPPYPSIYTLWAISGVLPVVLTNSFVIERVLDNANLMLPGCIPPFDRRMVQDAVVGIADYRAPTVVMAVGVCALNLSQFDVVQGYKGTAVVVKHYVGCGLFSLYDEKVQVPALVALSILKADEQALANEKRDEQTDTDPSAQEKALAQENTKSAVSVEDLLVEKLLLEETQQKGEETPELRTEEVDNFFVRSFIQAVKRTAIETPISSSTLMSDHVLKNLPRIDAKYKSIKKTTWKKSGKFLKHLEKLGFLSLKGKDANVTVIGITVPEDILVNFVTHKTGEAKGPTSKKNNSKMTVVSLYKPANKTRSVFSNLDLDCAKTYTAVELRMVVQEYVKKHQLVNKKLPKLVDLDATLGAATSHHIDIPLSRDALCTAFVQNCLPYYAIFRAGEEFDAALVKKGQPGKIKITTQTVLGRKTTTTVLNFEHFHIKLQRLAEDLKNVCSGSSAVHPCKQNPSVMEVMVQGPHGAMATEYLKSKGVPAAYIEFEDKSKGKRKR